MTEVPAVAAGPKHRGALQTFGVGLAVRLLGLLLIWAGDGHTSVFSKAVVVVGVILSLGGIAILKYLLYAGLKKKPKRVTEPDDRC